MRKLLLLAAVCFILTAQVPVRLQTAPTVSTPAQTAVSTTSIQILAGRDSYRRQVIVHNSGTTIIYLSLGTTTTTATGIYHVALPGGTAANDGTGGTFITDMWQGAIQAISSATGGKVQVTEITQQ